MASDVTEPDPKAIVGGAFTAAAPTYDDVVEFFGPFGRALAASADLAPGERVLDIACGRGASLYPALEAVGSTGHVLGIDLAQGMVDQLGADLGARGVANAEVRQGDAEALDLPDASFDAVLGGFMIFFAPRAETVLAELHRVTRPGGRVALSIFDGSPGFGWMVDVAKALFGEQVPRPSDAFNRADVLDPALVAAGFDQPSAVEVTERFLFTSPAHVEAWQRSHAGRLMLDRLDDEGLARYRELLAEHLEGHRVADGFELVQRARMTVARRPA